VVCRSQQCRRRAGHCQNCNPFVQACWADACSNGWKESYLVNAESIETFAIMIKAYQKNCPNTNPGSGNRRQPFNVAWLATALTEKAEKEPPTATVSSSEVSH
jgi:hypothetical protein